MGPGFGKGRMDFKYSLAGLGAFQGEQVEGSMDFWCGAPGNLRIAGPAADREKPSDANRRWRRSRAWLGGLRKVGGRGRARSLPGRSPFPPWAGPVLPPAIACCPVISSCGVARTQLDRGPAPAALIAFTRWTWRTPALTLAPVRRSLCCWCSASPSHCRYAVVLKPRPGEWPPPNPQSTETMRVVAC